MSRPLRPKPPTLPCRYNLQPANSGTRVHEQSEIFTPQAKRTQVRVACMACQRKKAKASQPLEDMVSTWFALTIEQCDGLRPSCAPCAKRGVVCEYEAEPDVSRLTSLRRRIEALQAERDLLYGMLVCVRTCSESDAQEVFRQLRVCSDPIKVAKALSN